MFNPLVIDTSKWLANATNIVDSIDPAGTAQTAFHSAGTGLGSIFILFVIFYYVTSILDGGKFQMKMLWPLVLYILVANFSIVSGVASALTGGLKAGLTASTQEGKVQVQMQGLGSEAEGGTLMRSFMKASKPAGVTDGMNLDQAISAYLKETHDELVSDKNGDNSDDTVKASFLRDMFVKTIGRLDEQLDHFLLKVKCRAIDACMDGALSPSELISGANSILPWMICWFLDFVSTAVAYCMVVFGGILTKILLAFGPVTWSFAIFPGNGKVLGSWFIRLCQFTLYGPIAMLIQTFMYSVCFSLAGVTNSMGDAGGVSYIALSVVLICCIIAMMNVPSIASMIIEGASGGISMMASAQTLVGLADLKHDSHQTKMLRQMTGTGKGGPNSGGNNAGGSGGGAPSGQSSGPRN